ncbi:MAG: hypothetical protein U0271_37965 [Polyangiaceae bacterium]
MPLPLAPLVAFALGVLLGTRQGGALGARGWNRARAAARLFAFFALFPTLAFGALVRPRWAMLHLFGELPLPSAATLAGAALASAFVELGHRAAERLETSPRSTLRVLTAVPLLTVLLVGVVLHRRIGLSLPSTPTTQPELLLHSTFGLFLLGIDVVVLLALGLTGYAIEALNEPIYVTPEPLGVDPLRGPRASSLTAIRAIREQSVAAKAPLDTSLLDASNRAPTRRAVSSVQVVKAVSDSSRQPPRKS